MSNRVRLVGRFATDALELATARFVGAMNVRPDGLRVNAADRFIFSLIRDGLWAKISEGGLCFADNIRDAVVGLKGLARPTVINTVSATGRLGIIGDGSTSYVQTGLDCGTDLPGFTQNSHSVFIGLTTNDVGSVAEIGAFQGLANRISVTGSTAGGKATFADNVTAQTFGNANALGLTGGSRDSAATGFTGRDGITLPMSLISSALPTGSSTRQLCLLRGGTTPLNYSTNRLLFWWTGSALTEAEYQLLYAAYYQLTVDLGISDVLIPPEISDLAGVFDKNAINNVTPSTMRVFMLATPPASNDIDLDTYNFFPASDFVTRPWATGLLDSTFTPVRGGGVHELMWSDRGERDTVGGPITSWSLKPNDNMGLMKRSTTFVDGGGLPIIAKGTECRPAFTTKTRAVGSFLTKTAYTVGYLDRNEPSDPRNWGYLDYAEHFDLLAADVHPWTYYRDNADALFQIPLVGFAVCYDKVILGQARMADVPNFAVRGIVIDLEHTDRRPAALLNQQITYASDICHAKGFQLRSTGSTAGTTGGGYTGWSIDTAPTIMEKMDGYQAYYNHSNPLQPAGPQLDAQVEMARVNSGPIVKAKLVAMSALGIGANAQTADEATDVRAWILLNLPGCTFITRGGRSQGGLLSDRWNQVIAIIHGLPTS